MKRLLLSALALFVLAFALYGILATFEPLERSVQILCRIAYALLAVGALASFFAIQRRR